VFKCADVAPGDLVRMDIEVVVAEFGEPASISSMSAFLAMMASIGWRFLGVVVIGPSALDDHTQA
jgi:hypothetical protein